jgi:quinol monooxygenase YgiN
VRQFCQLVLSLIVLSASLASPAHAQGAAGPVYLTTYFEVIPASANAGAGLLRQYREASRKEDGNQRFEVIQEASRPNRFVILEVWKSQAALDAHRKAAHTTQFRDKYKAIQSSPFDERVNTGMLGGPMEGSGGKGAAYIVTHVDVPPPSKDACITALKTLTDAVRKEAGNVRYEVQQQANRQNHFTVVQVWKNRAAFDGHVAGAAERQFRDTLTPMTGALYDERIYRAI